MICNNCLEVFVVDAEEDKPFMRFYIEKKSERLKWAVGTV